MTECEYCHRSGHVWFQCPKKPDGWKPERLAKRSAAARKDVPEKGLEEQQATGGLSSVSRASLRKLSDESGTQALPADTIPKPKHTRKGDRHSPGYMAKYMREYRAKIKAQKNER